jgi:hypothetical protein
VKQRKMVINHCMIVAPLIYLLFVAASSHTLPRLGNTKIKQNRTCYRNIWFSQAGCELDPNHNASCSSVPHYDCDSFYVGMQGRHVVEEMTLTRTCQRSTTADLFNLQPTSDRRATPCQFEFVCEENPNRIPSSSWKAKLLRKGEAVCERLPGGGFCEPVWRATTVLEKVGCDHHVGQYRYVSKVVEQRVAYACIQHIDLSNSTYTGKNA